MALSDTYNQRPPKEEVINDPTVPKHYWRYRMHVNVETLAADRNWLQQLKTMVADSGRG